MPNEIRNTVLTFAAGGEIQRYKPSQGAKGVIMRVHDDNPALTFEIATTTNNQVFTGSGSGATSIPTTAEFNDREAGNGTVFSSSNPADTDFGYLTDILIRVSASGKVIVKDVI